MTRTSPPENPYLAARMEWNERYGSYVRAAQSWRIVSLVSLTMAVIAFAYALYQSAQVKLVPYIVQVDKLGSPAFGGMPSRIEYADERVVRASLGAWISALRSVSPDTIVQKSYIDRTYALLMQADPATQKINDWFRNNSPFDRSRTLTTAVEVNNVVALSPQSYQVDWTEIERDRTGKELRTRRFRGIATVAMLPPQDEAVIRLNPIGLYLKDFEWTAQL